MIRKESIKGIIREFHTGKLPRPIKRDISLPDGSNKIISIVGNKVVKFILLQMVGTFSVGSEPDVIAIILGNVWAADNNGSNRCSQGLTNNVEITDEAVSNQYFPYPGQWCHGSF